MDARPAGPEIVGVVVGEVEVGEAGLHQPGGQRGRRAEGVAVGAHGQRCPAGCRLPRRCLRRGRASACDSGTWLERAGVGQHALEVADDEVAGEAGRAAIEQTPAAVGRHAVGQRGGAQVDVADEGEARPRRGARGGRRQSARAAGKGGGPACRVARPRAGRRLRGRWCLRAGRRRPPTTRPAPRTCRRPHARAGPRLPAAGAPRAARRRLRSRPTTASSSFTGSETVEPVSATRTGCITSPSLSPCVLRHRLQRVEDPLGVPVVGRELTRARRRPGAGFCRRRRPSSGSAPRPWRRAATRRDRAAPPPARPRGGWCASGPSPRR